MELNLIIESFVRSIQIDSLREECMKEMNVIFNDIYYEHDPVQYVRVWTEERPGRPGRASDDVLLNIFQKVLGVK